MENVLKVNIATGEIIETQEEIDLTAPPMPPYSPNTEDRIRALEDALLAIM